MVSTIFHWFSVILIFSQNHLRNLESIYIYMYMLCSIIHLNIWNFPLEYLYKWRNRDGSRGRGARGAWRPPLKFGKNMIFWRKIKNFHTKYPKFFRASLRNWKKYKMYDFFGVKSWFFTRNTPKISRLPPLGAIILSAPPLILNTGSAPVYCLFFRELLLLLLPKTACLQWVEDYVRGWKWQLIKAYSFHKLVFDRRRQKS